jgi:hypothetical protein
MKINSVTIAINYDGDVTVDFKEESLTSCIFLDKDETTKKELEAAIKLLSQAFILKIEKIGLL